MESIQTGGLFVRDSVSDKVVQCLNLLWTLPLPSKVGSLHSRKLLLHRRKKQERPQAWAGKSMRYFMLLIPTQGRVAVGFSSSPEWLTF